MGGGFTITLWRYMSRPKKNKVLQVKKNIEVKMTEEIIEKPIEMGVAIQENQEVLLDGLATEIDMSRLELAKINKEIEERKQSLKLMSSREIEPREQEIMDRQAVKKVERTSAEEKLARMKEYDCEKVTGRFMNRHRPGQPIKLPYMKYPEDPCKWWPFEDGKVYTIPRGFANQINGGDESDPCYYVPKFIQKEGPMDPDQDVSQLHSVDSSRKRYAFVPVGF